MEYIKSLSETGERLDLSYTVSYNPDLDSYTLKIRVTKLPNVDIYPPDVVAALPPLDVKKSEVEVRVPVERSKKFSTYKGYRNLFFVDKRDIHNDLKKIGFKYFSVKGSYVPALSLISAVSKWIEEHFEGLDFPVRVANRQYFSKAHLKYALLREFLELPERVQVLPQVFKDGEKMDVNTYTPAGDEGRDMFVVVAATASQGNGIGEVFGSGGPALIAISSQDMWKVKSSRDELQKEVMQHLGMVVAPLPNGDFLAFEKDDYLENKKGNGKKDFVLPLPSSGESEDKPSMHKVASAFVSMVGANRLYSADYNPRTGKLELEFQTGDKLIWEIDFDEEKNEVRLNGLNRALSHLVRNTKFAEQDEPLWKVEETEDGQLVLVPKVSSSVKSRKMGR